VSESLTALALGTLLAIGALAFVLYPLFFDVVERQQAAPPESGAADDSAVRALREIEFDRATGKLSDADYAELKTTYSERALHELRDADQLRRAVPAEPVDESVPLDPIEAKAREYRLRHRACADCGVRPEPAAVYCSTCGGYLPRACPRCAATVTESSAAYCSTCGVGLASADALVSR
jgi:hypothetical protein